MTNMRRLCDKLTVAVPLLVAALFAMDMLIPSIQAQRPAVGSRAPLPRLAAPRLPPSDAAFRDGVGAIVASSLGAVDMTHAERFSIRFQGNTELSGEYRVRGDDTISMPVVGRVALAGLSQQALETAIASRLAAATGREAYVSVEVLEYRPVFVAGQASRPGAFAWRPDMTVLHALALAGGTFRSGSSDGASNDQDGEIVRLQKAVSDQKRNLASLARLQAERKGALKIELPAKLVELVGLQEAQRLVGSQTTALQTRKATMEAKVAAIENAIKLSQAELVGLNDLIERMKADVKVARKYKETVEGLHAKGLVSGGRSFELTARSSDFTNQLRMLAVAVTNVRGQAAMLERDRVSLVQSRQAEIDEEILKLEGSIAQLDIDIGAIRSSYQKLTGHEPPKGLAASEQPRKLAVKHAIVRRTAAGSVNLDATQNTALKPGDTLVVGFEETTR